MSNFKLHVTFQVHTWYILVHTYMYHLINHVLVCTSYQYVPVCTKDVRVCTKYPDLVQPVTIPDDHLFFCKCPDYYFSLSHDLQKDNYFTYDTSIISLVFSVIYYCYFRYYDTIVCIIFVAYYYNNYFIRKVLY